MGNVPGSGFPGGVEPVRLFLGGFQKLGEARGTGLRGLGDGFLQRGIQRLHICRLDHHLLPAFGRFKDGEIDAIALQGFDEPLGVSVGDLDGLAQRDPGPGRGTVEGFIALFPRRPDVFNCFEQRFQELEDAAASPFDRPGGVGVEKTEARTGQPEHLQRGLHIIVCHVGFTS